MSEIEWLRELRDAVADYLAHPFRKFTTQPERAADYWRARERLEEVWSHRPDDKTQD